MDQLENNKSSPILVKNTKKESIKTTTTEADVVTSKPPVSPINGHLNKELTIDTNLNNHNNRQYLN